MYDNVFYALCQSRNKDGILSVQLKSVIDKGSCCDGSQELQQYRMNLSGTCPSNFVCFIFYAPGKSSGRKTIFEKSIFNTGAFDRFGT